MVLTRSVVRVVGPVRRMVIAELPFELVPVPVPLYWKLSTSPLIRPIWPEVSPVHVSSGKVTVHDIVPAVGNGASGSAASTQSALPLVGFQLELPPLTYCPWNVHRPASYPTSPSKPTIVTLQPQTKFQRPETSIDPGVGTDGCVVVGATVVAGVVAGGCVTGGCVTGGGEPSTGPSVPAGRMMTVPVRLSMITMFSIGWLAGTTTTIVVGLNVGHGCPT